MRDRGAIVPGARADLVALGDLTEFRALRVWHGGALVAEDGHCLVDPAAPPGGAGDTVRVDWDRVDLRLRAPASAHARVIGVIPDSILTEALDEEPPRSDGAVVADAERDLAHLAVVERHTGASGASGCLVRGLGLRRGAIASTVAHDHHNLMLAGVDEDDMLLAGREAARLGGGWVAAAGGEVLAALALPVAGLMSPAPVEEVRADLDAVLAAARSLGSELANPYMTLSFLGLEVIPKLKLTDKGLVDVERFELVEPFPA
jgi:adenine deaminase